MKPADHIIEKCGGVPALARMLGHKHATTVQGWRDRGFIPPKRYPDVLRAAREHCIDLKPEDFLSPELYEIASCTDGIAPLRRVTDRRKGSVI